MKRKREGVGEEKKINKLIYSFLDGEGHSVCRADEGVWWEKIICSLDQILSLSQYIKLTVNAERLCVPYQGSF